MSKTSKTCKKTCFRPKKKSAKFDGVLVPPLKTRFFDVFFGGSKKTQKKHEISPVHTVTNFIYVTCLRFSLYTAVVSKHKVFDKEAKHVFWRVFGHPPGRGSKTSNFTKFRVFASFHENAKKRVLGVQNAIWGGTPPPGGVSAKPRFGDPPSAKSCFGVPPLRGGCPRNLDSGTPLPEKKFEGLPKNFSRSASTSKKFLEVSKKFSRSDSTSQKNSRLPKKISRRPKTFRSISKTFREPPKKFQRATRVSTSNSEFDSVRLDSSFEIQLVARSTRREPQLLSDDVCDTLR